MGKSCVVTGGYGFIGSNLVKRLITLGWNVTVLDNMARGSLRRLENWEDDFEYIDCDLRDFDGISRHFMCKDTVFHLAAVNGTENFYTRPQLVLDVGIKSAMNVMTASSDAGVPQVIHASSAEVYQHANIIPTPENIDISLPDTLNPRYSYAGSKIITELIAFNYYADCFESVQVFRPHNVYGPDMGFKHVIPQFIQKVLSIRNNDNENSFEIEGTGQETRAFAFVDDVIDGILLMQEKRTNREIYHIGNDEEISIFQLAKEVLQITNTFAEIKFISDKRGATPRRCPNITKLKELGYKPRFNLRAGLMETIPWYMSNFELGDNKLL
jgi:UDP-glucose 4-epimerase